MSQKLTYQRNMEEQNPFLNRDEETPEPEQPLAKAEAKRSPIPIGPNGIEITNSEQAARFASLIYKSRLLPNSFKTPEQVVIAILRAIELKLPILQALEGMSVINGKVGVMGDLALALVQSSGLLEDITDTCSGEGDELTATVTVKRKEKPTPTVRTFSMAQAKRAKITGSTAWQGYPERMLYYRALGFALRDAFPDVLRSIRTTEELSDYQQGE